MLWSVHERRFNNHGQIFIPRPLRGQLVFSHLFLDHSAATRRLDVHPKRLLCSWRLAIWLSISRQLVLALFLGDFSIPRGRFAADLQRRGYYARSNTAIVYPGEHKLKGDGAQAHPNGLFVQSFGLV